MATPENHFIMEVEISASTGFVKIIVEKMEDGKFHCYTVAKPSGVTQTRTFKEISDVMGYISNHSVDANNGEPFSNK